jgi:hypothetical protein
MHCAPIKVVRKAVATALCFGVLILTVNSFARAQGQQIADGKFDKFGNVNAEDAMARLDLFAVQLNGNPKLQGFIVLHTQTDSPVGWQMREAYGYLAYLVNSRGVPASSVKVLEADARKEIGYELWLLPAGSAPPLPPPAPKPGPTFPVRFDEVPLGDESKCVGEFTIELYKIEDVLKLFGEALRRQPAAKAWIVIHPRVREPLATVRRTIDTASDLLIRHYGISSERVLTAIGPRPSSICTGVNLWIVPASSVRPDEAGYYSQLMDEAEKTQYTVRRVEFTGIAHIRDRTLRRRFLQQEGDVFSRKALEQSLKNFSKLGIIYPLTLNDIEVRLNREEKLIDFTIYFRERLYVSRGSKIY